ncbi:sensor histidine kinase [Candidatus Roseilinea sp. NK_OTU-006]|nr:HAMP domain-containing sensor histidine kinase [Candidatus Roseilinea sp. NK_OTU-006]
MATATASSAQAIAKPSKRRLTLRAQLILTHWLIVFFGLGGLVIWSAYRSQVEIIESTEHDLEIQNHLLAIVLHDQIEATLNGYLSSEMLREELVLHRENPETRITVLDDELFVLASTDPKVPIGKEDQHIELVAARNRREEHDIRWDSISNAERVFTAAPVLDANKESIAYIQLSAPMQPVRERIYASWSMLGGVWLLITLIAGGIAVITARRMAQPLTDLTRAAQSMAHGELHQQAAISGPQEVAKLVEVFNSMSERLERMINRQKQFVANAAHELRSPLAAMRLRLEMMQAQRLTPDETPQFLDAVLRSLDQLHRTIDQLLMLSALDEGNHPPLAPLDLAPMLYDLAEQVQPLAHTANVTVEVDVPPHLPPVLANAEQMRVMVWNLLDNACKYTPAGRRIGVRAEAKDGQVCVQVWDNGPSLPPDVQARLFERFQRGARDRHRRAGSGLGLALVHELAQVNRVRINVESRPDRGTTFTLCCDVHRTDAPRPGSPQPTSAPRG